MKPYLEALTMRRTIYNVFTHVRVLAFWIMFAFSIYGMHHAFLKINGWSKCEAAWNFLALYMKWA